MSAVLDSDLAPSAYVGGLARRMMAQREAEAELAMLRAEWAAQARRLESRFALAMVDALISIRTVDLALARTS